MYSIAKMLEIIIKSLIIYFYVAGGIYLLWVDFYCIALVTAKAHRMLRGVNIKVLTSRTH